MIRGATGYGILVDPDRPQPTEWDTCTCGHCSRAIFTKPGSASTTYMICHRDGRWTEEPGAFCRVCMRPVCLRCHDLGTCLPFERWIEQQESSHGA